MKEKHHEKIIHNRTPSLIIVCSIQAINKGKIHAQDAPYFRNKYSISDEEYMDGAFQWIIHLRMTFYHRISISPWSKDLIFQKVQRNQCLQFQPLYLKNQIFFLYFHSEPHWRKAQTMVIQWWLILVLNYLLFDKYNWISHKKESQV